MRAAPEGVLRALAGAPASAAPPRAEDALGRTCDASAALGVRFVRGGNALLTLAFTAKIAASPRQVWHELVSPASAARWLPNHEGWTEAPSQRLSAQSALRFRSRLRGIPVPGELLLLASTPGRVHARVRIGLLSFDARFSVAAESHAAGSTRVGLLLTLANKIAVVGGSIDRFAVRRLASELAEQTLAALTACAEGRARAARRA